MATATRPSDRPAAAADGSGWSESESEPERISTKWSQILKRTCETPAKKKRRYVCIANRNQQGSFLISHSARVQSILSNARIVICQFLEAWYNRNQGINARILSSSLRRINTVYHQCLPHTQQKTCKKRVRNVKEHAPQEIFIHLSICTYMDPTSQKCTRNARPKVTDPFKQE